jgi:hypothetical protein
MEMGVALGLDGTADARGFAASDFDHDGDVDLVVNNYNAPAYYYLNDWNREGNWLAVRLEGRKNNRDGVGSVISARIDEHTQNRLVGAGHAYTGQFSLEQVFGMGQSENAQLQVRWPDGSVEDFGTHQAGGRIVLTEGEGRPDPLASSGVATSASTASGDRPSWVRMLSLIAVAVLALFFISQTRTKPKRKDQT